MARGLEDKLAAARGGQAGARGDGATAGNGQPAADSPAGQRHAMALEVVGELRKLRDEFALAMPGNVGVNPDQLIRDAVTQIRRHERDFLSSDTDLETILGAVMTCAQLGLRLGVLGQAWVLPFWNKGRGVREAVFVPGYRGLVQLAFRSGIVTTLSARTVYENELADFEFTSTERGDVLRHRPRLIGDRGKPVLYYARGGIRGGGYQLTEPTNHDDMLAHRDANVKVKSGPWFEDTGKPECGFEWMAWKTELIRLCKYLPVSPTLATAIAVDEGVRRSTNPKADAAAVTEPTVEGDPRTIPGEWREGGQADGGTAGQAGGGQAADGVNWSDIPEASPERPAGQPPPRAGRRR